MRPLFRGDGCAINEAGISAAGNPLSRLLDAAAHDPLHAQQLREAYLGGPQGPMGAGPMGHMLEPMKPGGFEHAWRDSGPLGSQLGHGPALGAAMQAQLLRHMGPGAELGPEAGFFAGPMLQGPGPMGPMGPMGLDWAREFAGPRSGPMGPDWAGEFARHGPHPQAEMEAAFHQEAAVRAAEARGHAELERAFGSAGPGPHELEGFRMAGPMGLMGPMGMPMPMGMGMPMPIGMAPMFRQGAPASSSVDMEAAFQQSQMEAAFREGQEAAAQEAQVTDNGDLGQAAQMVEMLRNSGNPKFANSQFVDFIDRVSKGDLQFRENTVIDREGNQVDWDSLYDTAAATASDQERRELEGLWEASGRPEDLGELSRAWGETMPQMPQGADLERLWQDAGQASMEDAWRFAEGPGADALEQAWLGNEEFNMDQVWNHGSGKGAEYKFQEDNPYLDSADPLAEAQRLIREGRDREAVLALEAEVQRNPESSEGWRMLGQLFAELDQDIEAIQCLRRGHAVDPYNLDSLLALGVSCTNELDQLPALRYLRMWIESHEEHQAFVQGIEPPPDYEYEAWKQQVTSLFNQAAQANPLDANVFIALGVIQNINRNYDAAIQALAAACRLRPNDHTVWNKLGATLANSGKSEQAVMAYHQGLQLKPNYARSWSNLAIAHANLGQHADAARFYLSSLVLNPAASHIWGFLHTAVLNMDDMAAMRAVDQRDLAAATQAVQGVLDPTTLPMPQQELPQPPHEILAAMGL